MQTYTQGNITDQKHQSGNHTHYTQPSGNSRLFVDFCLTVIQTWCVSVCEWMCLDIFKYTNTCVGVIPCNCVCVCVWMHDKDLMHHQCSGRLFFPAEKWNISRLFVRLCVYVSICACVWKRKRLRRSERKTKREIPGSTHYLILEKYVHSRLFFTKWKTNTAWV